MPNKYLFIAEKPSVMRKVQAVYNKYTKEVIARAGGEIVFTAVAGHVCGYAPPKAYEPWGGAWSGIQLPMVPDEWKIMVNPSTKDVYQRVTKAYKENGCNAIIVATDADVEGNGIYYLMEQKARWGNIPTYRFFPNDETDRGILKALYTLTDFHSFPRDTRMTEAFILRSQFDWLVGMNMTVAVTVKQGTLMRIGRVKAPTLKMIYDNCKAIDEFVPRTTYGVASIYVPGFAGLMIGEDGKAVEFEERAEAQAAADALKNETYGTVRSCDSQTVKTKAPKLFNLARLQIEAGSKFGYAPEATLQAVQNLYEANHLSYPRTDCQYISTEKAKELKVIISRINNVPELAPFIAGIPAGSIDGILGQKTYVNDAEVQKSSHDALLPTHIAPDLKALPEIERNIYLFVAKRLISIFYPPLEELKSVLLVDVRDKTFKSNGTSVKNPGWTSVMPRKQEGAALPPYKPGDTIGIKEIGVKEKTTKPPKRFTEPSLIAAMDNVASLITNKDYKDILKEEKGIGTPASRTGILSDLRKTGYYEVIKQGIYITALGKQYVECLAGFDLVSPELTADMDLHIKHVKEGSEDFRAVYGILQANALKMIAQAQNMATAAPRQSAFTSIPCPACGGKLEATNWGVKCANEACGFTCGTKVAGKQLTDAQVKSLLTEKKTDVISGFTSKAGKKFNARLVVNGDKVAFDFSEEESKYRCPFCNSPMASASWGFKCTAPKESCGFTLGSRIAQKQLPASAVKKLLETGDSGLIKGFTSAKGKKFDAHLVLDYEKKGAAFSFK